MFFQSAENAKGDMIRMIRVNIFLIFIPFLANNNLNLWTSKYKECAILFQHYCGTHITVYGYIAVNMNV